MARRLSGSDTLAWITALCGLLARDPLKYANQFLTEALLVPLLGLFILFLTIAYQDRKPSWMLAAGAALGAAAAGNSAPATVQSGAPVTRNGIPPWTPAWYQYCSSKYKSFNAQTGLYLGYDGKYHYCQ